MKVRELINNYLCAFFDKQTGVRECLLKFSQAVFPFPIFERIKKKAHLEKGLSFAVNTYLYILIYVFIYQAMFSLYNGTFFWDKDLNTIRLSEDFPNLFNYLIVVQGYCIFGVGFIRSLVSMETEIKKSGLNNHIEYSPPMQPIRGGYGGVIAIIIIVTTQAFSYYSQCLQLDKIFWFHEPQTTSLTYSFLGYYYQFLNIGLLLFVVIVFMLHFGLFLWTSSISDQLRNISNSELTPDIWLKEDKLKSTFQPFVKTILWSKAFIVFISLNIVTLKNSDISNVGANVLDFWIITYLIIGVWVISLPRYIIQYHLYNIWNKNSTFDYKDIRMPTAIGISNLLNVFIFFIAGKLLVNLGALKFLGNLKF